MLTWADPKKKEPQREEQGQVIANWPGPKSSSAVDGRRAPGTRPEFALLSRAECLERKTHLVFAKEVRLLPLWNVGLFWPPSAHKDFAPARSAIRSIEGPGQTTCGQSPMQPLQRLGMTQYAPGDSFELPARGRPRPAPQRQQTQFAIGSGKYTSKRHTFVRCEGLGRLAQTASWHPAGKPTGRF